jgi:hypothetical protein
MKQGRGREKLSLPPSLTFLPFLSTLSYELLVCDSFEVPVHTFQKQKALMPHEHPLLYCFDLYA